MDGTCDRCGSVTRVLPTDVDDRRYALCLGCRRTLNGMVGVYLFDPAYVSPDTARALRPRPNALTGGEWVRIRAGQDPRRARDRRRSDADHDETHALEATG